MMPFDQLPIFVRETGLIRDVVESLNKSGMRISLVTDGERRLLATVTDGDIRRGLLSGFGLDDSVLKLGGREFVSAIESASVQDLQMALVSSGVSHLPILDESGRVIGMFPETRNVSPTTLGNVVVIMAGGLGMRLRPMTDTIPKPMLRVAGKPMLEHIVENLRLEGFTDFIISINYLGEIIKEHFGDGSQHGVNITYISEDKPLGTAGALSLIPQNFSQPFVVLNGDVLVKAKIREMLDFHLGHGAELTVGVKVLDTQIPFGVVTLKNGRILALEEKPTYRDFVNAGIYVLSPEVLDDIPVNQKFDMTDLVANKIEGGGPMAFPLHESWIDLGRPEDFERADQTYGEESR